MLTTHPVFRWLLALLLLINYRATLASDADAPTAALPSDTNRSKVPPGEAGTFLSLKHLPPLLQTQDRVLVANVLAPRNRQHLLVKHLHNLVNMCELGFEVHVVLVTSASWVNNTFNMFEPSFFRCNRLSQDLPIVEVLTNRRITSFHRNVFSYLKNDYDYYIDHEDDVMFTPQHLMYFKKWVGYFQGTNYLPGFAVGEVLANRAKFLEIDLFQAQSRGEVTSGSSINNATDAERGNSDESGRRSDEVASFYRNSEMFWHSFTAHNKRAMHIITHRGVPMLYLEKAWNPGYIMTRHMLQHFSTQPEWLNDRKRSYREINTHYQHMWLARHFRIVIPIQDFRIAMVHHAPNKYVQASFANDFMLQRNASVEHLQSRVIAVREMEAALDVCMRDSPQDKSLDKPQSASQGSSSDPMSWRINNISYVISGDIGKPSPMVGCAACLNEGKATYANFKFLGPAESALRSRSSSLVVELRCDAVLITQERAVDETKELRLDSWELGSKSVRLTTMGSGVLHKSDAFPIYMHPLVIDSPDAGRYEDPTHSARLNRGVRAAPVSDYVWPAPRGEVNVNAVKMKSHRFSQSQLQRIHANRAANATTLRRLNFTKSTMFNKI